MRTMIQNSSTRKPLLLAAALILLAVPNLSCHAFTVAPFVAGRSSVKSPSALRDANADLETKATTAVIDSSPSSSLKVSSADDKPTSNTMDPTMFQFNKFMIDTIYDILCLIYPVRGTERDFARFYVLETVARVPYFAYLSVLHLRETLGQRGQRELMRTHYAQADNELHHLLIMEELGGNEGVVDRIFAQSMAFVYYWYVIVMYLWKEPAAYHLSELIEDHAFDTYNTFLNNYQKRLKAMPVPDIARQYYERDNPFLFDLFCTVGDCEFSKRRPKLETLYDVFQNIRDDEKEHWKTLCNLVQYSDMNAVPPDQIVSTRPTEVATASS